MQKKMLYIISAAGLLCCTSCRHLSGYKDRELAVLGVIGIILALFLLLAIYSNMLRDEIADYSQFNKNARLAGRVMHGRVNREYPFSLVKVQFGVWTVIICSSYVYLSLLQGDCTEVTINKTALVLLGIFSGTAVTASLIDKREKQDGTKRYQDRPSQGFFTDILSDQNGISMHRFQGFAWTLIAITVYLYKLTQVEEGCALPELSDTLLSLTGISNATYLVLRSNENDTIPARAGAGTQAPSPPPVSPGDPEPPGPPAASAVLPANYSSP